MKRAGAWLRNLVIAITAFLTVTDLFAAQAILPMLSATYRVTPARMGLAVNACTLGMAIAGLAMSLAGGNLDRRRTVLASLLLLALPTALLSLHPPLAIFAALRVTQGLCMATAFTLTLAYLGEHGGGADTASAFAAYVTGNVASNLVGRLIAGGVAGQFGLGTTFVVFACLNIAGALLVFFTIEAAPRMHHMTAPMRPGAAWRAMLRDRRAVACCLIGFCILFAFIGIFTYVNYVLARPPIGLGMMQIGIVYFVFMPSIVTTPLTARLVARLGARGAMRAALGLSGVALVPLLAPRLPALLVGMIFVAVGLFLAQAVATNFISRVAPDRAAGSGLYLACYFSGGLAGTACLGALFDWLGWVACVAGVAAALAIATALATSLRPPAAAA